MEEAALIEQKEQELKQEKSHQWSTQPAPHLEQANYRNFTDLK